MFGNNYFKSGLLAWQAKMDVQPVFDEYKLLHTYVHIFQNPKINDETSC